MANYLEEEPYWARDSIDICKRSEVEYWSYKLGVPIGQLIQTHASVGPLVKDIAVRIAVNSRPIPSRRTVISYKAAAARTRHL
jgi:hypothetical protein